MVHPLSRTLVHGMLYLKAEYFKQASLTITLNPYQGLKLGWPKVSVIAFVDLVTESLSGIEIAGALYVWTGMA